MMPLNIYHQKVNSFSSKVIRHNSFYVYRKMCESKQKITSPPTRRKLLAQSHDQYPEASGISCEGNIAVTKATSNVGIYTSHPVLHFIPDGKVFLHIRRFHHRNVGGECYKFLRVADERGGGHTTCRRIKTSCQPQSLIALHNRSR